MIVNLPHIKEKRKEKGYTMDQMADKLGLTNGSMYSKRENGHYRFKAEELMLLAKILNIPMKRLFLTGEYSKTEYSSEIV